MDLLQRLQVRQEMLSETFRPRETGLDLGALHGSNVLSRASIGSGSTVQRKMVNVISFGVCSCQFACDVLFLCE